VRNWTDLRYLQHGTLRQQEALAALRALGLWPALADFGPVLAGTVPLDIDIPSSDLDVLCEVPPAMEPRFWAVLLENYRHLPGFDLCQLVTDGLSCTVSNFFYLDFEIEVFGQAVPAVQQRAFRHMEVEYAILQAGGEPWQRAVRHLKLQGLKTEPAFAVLLHLPGDPYEALLSLAGKTTAELKAYLKQHPLL